MHIAVTCYNLIILYTILYAAEIINIKNIFILENSIKIFDEEILMRSYSFLIN